MSTPQVSGRSLFTNFPAAPPWYCFEEDFQKEYPLTSSLPVSASSPWIGTALSSGTFSQASTGADIVGGVAILSGAATTDNSGVQIQSDMQTFGTVAGKRLEMLCSFQLSDATDTEFFFGIAVADTTLLDGTGTLAGGLTHTNSYGLYKPDNETNVYGVVHAGSANTFTSAFTSLSDATQIVLGMRIDFLTATTAQINLAVNGVFAGGGICSSLIATSTILSPAIAFNSGNATGTKTATVDYIGIRQER